MCVSLREELLFYDVRMLLMYRHAVEVLVNIPEKCASCLLIPSDTRIMPSLCKLHPSIFGSVGIQDKSSCASCATNAVDVGMLSPSFLSHTQSLNVFTYHSVSLCYASYINYMSKQCHVHFIW